MRLCVRVCALAALLVLSPAPARELALPVQEKVLDNGLKVLVLEDPAIPNATLHLAWKVGSRNERPGITGLAHFFEHMMFSGGAKYGKRFDATMEAHGGSNNAYTTHDVTVYTDWFPASELPLILDMEADRMAGMNFDPRIVASEREVVASERRLSMDEPASVLAEQLWAAAYTAHPYQWDVLGWMVDIQHWTQGDLEAFFAAHYAPNNAVLVIVGDVEAEQVFAQVERAMGGLPRGPARRPIHTQEPPQRGERRVVVEDPDANAAQVMCAWHIPRTAHPDFAPLDVAEKLLLAGETSRLYRRLVDEEQRCLDVSGGWQGYQFDPSLFTVELLLREGQDPAAAEAAVYAELARLRDEGPAAAELAKAKRQIVAGLLRQLTTQNGKAGVIVDTELFFGGWRNLQARADAVEAVGAEDVQRVLATYLRPRNRTVATLVPGGEPLPEEAPTEDPPADAPPAEGPPADAPPAEDPPAAAPPADDAPRPASPRLDLRGSELLTLDCGAKALLVAEPGAPLLTFSLRLDGGALLDPEGGAGAAALLATLLERGAGERDAQAFKEAIEAVGGRLRISARKRWLEVEAEFLREDADLGFELLGDLLRRPRLDADEFAKERAKALDALKAARDEPSALVGAYWGAWAYRGHPYARPTDGDERQLAALEHAQVVALAERQLAPGRTWFAVAGDLAELDVEARLEALCAEWSDPEGAAAAPPAVTARPGAGVLLVDAPGSLQTYFRAGNLGFAWSDPDYAARYLANTILGGRFTSRLNTALRIESGLTYGARSGFDDALGGMFALSSYTATATSREAIELARATYARFRAEGITPAELASARTYIQGQFAPDALETPAQRARMLLDLEHAGVPRARIEGLFQALDALELDAVNATIRRFPAPEELRWVLLGQARVLRELAEELGEVTEVPVSAPGFGPE